MQVGLWRKGQGEQWLEGADWVVDAIDNIDTKVDLLTHCQKAGIKVFASMGAGAKRDPTRIQIAHVYHSSPRCNAKNQRYFKYAGRSAGSLSPTTFTP